MLDIGWSELLLIGIVALIVVGPKDLPKLFHSLGRITAKARGMAREFSSAMEDAAKTSGLDDAAKSLRDVQSLTSKKALGLDALERATEKFEKWDPVKAARHQPATTGAATPPATTETLAPEGGAVPAAPAAPPADDAPAADAASQPAPQTGQRRLHATRRLDTKDL